MHSLLLVVLKEPELAKQLAELATHQRLGNPLLLDHSRHILLAALEQKASHYNEENTVINFSLRSEHIKKYLDQQLNSYLTHSIHRQLAHELSQTIIS